MINKIRLMLFLFLLSIMGVYLCACKNMANPTSPRVLSELQQGKRYFETGYYKSAMRTLLPLATEGQAEAQYAVGYMYYYGYGVAQDTEVGYFWIQKSASQHNALAIKALAMIKNKISQPPTKP